MPAPRRWDHSREVTEAGRNHTPDLRFDLVNRNRGINDPNAVWLTRRQLSRLETVSDDVDAKLPVVGDRATLNDALDTMLVSSAGAALVTGRRDTFLGVIDVETVMDAITRAHKHAMTAHSDGRPVGINTGTLDTVRVSSSHTSTSTASSSNVSSSNPGERPVE